MSDAKAAEELFADSDSGGDTDDLLQNAREQAAAARPKKKTKRLRKKGKISAKRKREIPDADDDSDSDDGVRGGGGSDEDDRPLSKRERMEKLARKKRESAATARDRKEAPVSSDKASRGDADGGGYDSGDSYNSGEFRRTKADDDFIDHEGEDEDLRREYEAEQHFDDEPPEGTDDEDEDENGRRRSRKKGGGRGGRPKKVSPDALSDDEDVDENGVPRNPIVAAVQRMKRKKKKKRDLDEDQTAAKDFLERMDEAAKEDEKSFAAKRPALKKLAMLQEVSETLAKVDTTELLLKEGLLFPCKRWIQPLPDGKLGNVTVRRRILEAIARMNQTGDGVNTGVTSEHLKQSGLGKVIMALYTHPSETTDLRKMLKDLIETWSRPIFRREGNMRRLGAARRSVRAAPEGERIAAPPLSAATRAPEDLASVIARGSRASSSSLGNNRVRVPYSKGFRFTVEPRDRMDPSVTRRGRAPVDDRRGELRRRMQTKDRRPDKNKRGMETSVDGKGLV